MFDFILKNGLLTDPASGWDASKQDIAVQDGVIAEIAPEIHGDAKNVVDLNGLTVTPGLIDFHAHFYSGGTNTSLEFSSYLPTGVTHAVDAGSAGDSNVESFLSALTPRERRHTDVFVNLASEGLSCLGEHPENIDPRFFNGEKLLRLCRRYPREIRGLKLRISGEIAEYSGTTSFDALRAAVRIAERCGLPLSVHMPNFQGELNELLDILRPGDIFCHVFTPQKGIGAADGGIDPEVFRGREKGIIFESACGKGHLGHQVASAAIARGFLPDVISGDLTRNTFGNLPAVSLPWLMSRFLAMGMSFADVLAAVTTTPARILGREGEIGCLAVGSNADIAVFHRRQGTFVFNDVRSAAVTGRELLVPCATMLEGEWVYNQLPYLQQSC